MQVNASRFSTKATTVATEDWEQVRDNDALRRLMTAILRDAMDCLTAGNAAFASNAQRKEAHAAAQWISDRDDEPLFSFGNVCETLGIDPHALRESLSDWVRSGRRLVRRSPVVHTFVRSEMYRRRRSRRRAASEQSAVATAAD